MAKLTALPHQSIIDGLKGTIDFYVHMGIPCARSWPKSPGKLRSQAVSAQWPAFTIAAKAWDTLSTEVKQACNDMAAPTQLTGKDFFMRSYISGLKYT